MQNLKVVKPCMSYIQAKIFTGLQGLKKILNDSTPLLMMPNGKERKTNINDATELVENAWD